jgi:hypothetical protein
MGPTAFLMKANRLIRRPSFTSTMRDLSTGRSLGRSLSGILLKAYMSTEQFTVERSLAHAGQAAGVAMIDAIVGVKLYSQRDLKLYGTGFGAINDVIRNINLHYDLCKSTMIPTCFYRIVEGSN